MSNTENSTPVDQSEEVDVNLDDFAEEFFNPNKVKSEDATETENTEDNSAEVSGETETDTNNDEENDALEPEESEEVEEEEGEEKPEPKKKNRFQERINELTSKAREAERKAQELEQKVNELLAGKEKELSKPQEKAETVEGPQPTDLNEDGSEKYPLGEFDPRYIRDLTKFTLAEERKKILAEEQARAEQEKIAQKQAELQTEWNGRLEVAQERYPDLTEKAENLVSALDGLDPDYGDYLATTIMTMEYGPDVLYYLASNPDEAKAIAASGAQKATVLLGRLEAKFAIAEEEKKKARPKTSKAPEPPTHLNKGGAPAAPQVPDDTDDLDAFEAKFFAKRRRR